jgi:hypothetical protein
MSKRLPFILTLVAFSALAARPEYDAFLSSPVRRALPERAGLTSLGKAALDSGSISSVEPRFGVPKFFNLYRETGVRTPRAMGLTAEQAARRHLLRYAELYQTSPTHFAEARVAHVHDLGTGAVVVSFQQDVRGTRVFRDELRVVMTPQLELVAFSGYLTPQLRRLGAFSLDHAAAVQTAFTDLTGLAIEPSDLLRKGTESGFSMFELKGEPTPSRAQNVWYAMPQGLEPGIYLELNVSGAATTDSQLYAYVVSARDGHVLYRHTLKQADAYSYRVWADGSPNHVPVDGPQGPSMTPHPTGNPDGSHPTPAYLAPSLVTVEHGPISTNDPWLAPGATQTIGNNVHAYLDLKAPDGLNAATGDVVGNVVSPNSFDEAYDVTQAPNASPTQQRAAVQSHFYITNFLHDWYYDVGFDEKSGNAQQSNLGRGGFGNDPLLAEGQDYSGTNNANMSTPSDGASPRMQMYVWTGAGVASMVFNNTTLSLGTASFGPKSFDVTGVTELAEDGVTTMNSTPNDICTGVMNDVRGKVALIERGICTFVSKAQRAAAAGAIAVVIMDNVYDTVPPGMGGSGTVTIPVVSVTQAQGALLQAAVGSTVSLHRALTVNPDGTVDNSVIGHEWGHYISNRLIGNANGLGNVQGSGMGEGWADFHAMLMLVRPEDAQVAANANWAGTYAMASYAGGAFTSDTYYFGIRRYPYSTDLSKNPLTLIHIMPGIALPEGPSVSFGGDGASNDEVHNTGEVWANMLWECYAALLNDPRYTFQQAQDRMRSYIVAAYKATPDLPTFTDARDAVLAVASAQDGADYAAFWRAFAKRGNGMTAIAPPADSPNNTPVTQSFAVGNSVIVTGLSIDDSVSSCDNDGRLDANEKGNANITIKNVGIGPVTAAQLTISSSVAGLTFPMGTSIAVPPLDRYASATIKLPAELGNVAGIQDGSLTAAVADASLVASPVVRVENIRLNYDLRPNISQTDSVETAPMTLWSTSSDATFDTSSPFRLYESSAFNHWWVGPSSSQRADTYLVSPALQVAPSTDLVVTFNHRYDFEQGLASDGSTVSYDGAVIELSTDDGATWTDIGDKAAPAYPGTVNANSDGSENTLDGRAAFVGTSPGYPAFNAARLALGQTYSGKTVRVRFHVASDNALALGRGWEIDDIGFKGILTKPFTGIVSDPNTCTNKAPVVTVGPDSTVDEGTTVALTFTATDADNDQLTSTWTQSTGPTVTLSSTNSFVAPHVRIDTPVIFDLTVTDGRAVVGPLSVTTTVRTTNRPPVATVKAKVDGWLGQTVKLEGGGTDPDNDPLTYQWTQLDGPELKLSDVTDPQATFVSPMVDTDKTTATLQLVASDGALFSDPVTVTVTLHKSSCGCSSGLDGGVMTVLGLALLSLRRRRGAQGA